MSLNTGQLIHNRYRVVRLLGQGGFGAVYRAWDVSLNKPVALKLNLDATPQAQQQFEREAKILGNLSHPNLPRVTDHFSVPQVGQFLVMDFIEGEDLEAIIEREGAIDKARAIGWIEQVAGALSYLHSQSPAIIHRDIKPANIRIAADGKAYLVDFGLVKLYTKHKKTTVGARAVTPGYSPPEQYGQGNTDARTDIYALAATLYVALTGQEPVESIQRIVVDELKLVSDVNQAVSPMVGKAIAKAMSLSPTKRFNSADAFQNALNSADSQPLTVPLQPKTVAAAPVINHDSTPLPPVPSQPLERNQSVHPVFWILGTAAAVILVFLMFILPNNREQAQQEMIAQQATVSSRQTAIANNGATETVVQQVTGTREAAIVTETSQAVATITREAQQTATRAVQRTATRAVRQTATVEARLTATQETLATATAYFEEQTRLWNSPTIGIWSNFADQDQELQHMIDVLELYLPNDLSYQIELLHLTSVRHLSDSLENTQILIIPELEILETNEILTYAEEFGEVLTEFVNDGGKVVITGDLDGTFMNASGLISTEVDQYIAGEYLFLHSSGEIAKNLPEQIQVHGASSSYQVFDNSAEPIYQADNGSLYAFVYPHGRGDVVVIGSDYFESSPAQDWLLINALFVNTPIQIQTQLSENMEELTSIEMSGELRLNERHYRWFNAQAGTVVSLSMDSNGDLDGELQLIDPLGNQIRSSSWTEDDENDAVITRYRLPRAGIYIVITTASDRNTVGTYTLKMERHNNLPKVAELPDGISIEEQIESQVQNYFFFEAMEGDYVTVVMTADAQSELNGFMTLYSEYGEFITSNSSGGQGVNPILSEVLIERTGRYYVSTGAYSEGQGSYSLLMTMHARPSGGGEIPLGGDVTGAFPIPGTQHIWRFEHLGGLRQLQVLLNCQSNADCSIELYRLDRRIARVFGTDAATLTYPIFEAGEYEVRVRAEELASDYTLSAHDSEAVIEGTIDQNQTVAGSLIANTPELWELNLTSAATLTFDLRKAVESSSFDTYIVIFNASGRNLRSNDDGGEGLNSLIEDLELSSGTYYILVREFGGRSGDYILEVK